jgi:SAM-dependent methyltransferase
MAKYTHTTEIHNLDSPREIVPVIKNLIPFDSVVDIGCGLGTFLKVFKDFGTVDVLGVDGKWCNKKLLFQNISEKEFVEKDLEGSLSLSRRFDLALSLEVGEHLSATRADSFVKELTMLSDQILFSAAVPFQGGDHHFNEQWVSYWQNKFLENDYILYDVLKPLLWDNPKIFWWYKQNMVLFIKAGKEPKSLHNLTRNDLKNVIHPEMLLMYANPASPNAVKRYLKLLVKAIKLSV